MTPGKRARRYSSAALVLGLALALAGPGTASAEPSRRTITKTYVTGDGGGYWMSTAVCDPGTDYGVGAVCLGSVTGGKVRIRIEDASGRPVGGRALITNGNDYTPLAAYTFCGRSPRIPLQPGVLFVYLDSPKNVYRPGCALDEFGFATVGKVHATFIGE